jgi:hypothetical protein
MTGDPDLATPGAIEKPGKREHRDAWVEETAGVDRVISVALALEQPMGRPGTHHHRWRCVGSMAWPAASGEPRGYSRKEWIRPTRANTSDPRRGQTRAREPEYPRGKIRHRVWQCRGAHRVWNLTSLFQGREKIKLSRSGKHSCTHNR